MTTKSPLTMSFSENCRKKSCLNIQLIFSWIFRHFFFLSTWMEKSSLSTCRSPRWVVRWRAVHIQLFSMLTPVRRLTASRFFVTRTTLENNAPSAAAQPEWRYQTCKSGSCRDIKCHNATTVRYCSYFCSNVPYLFMRIPYRYNPTGVWSMSATKNTNLLK